MLRTFVEVAIQTDDELLEKLIAVVSQLGFEGFWEDGRTLRCYMRSDRWQPELHGELQSITRMLARASSSPTPEISVTTIDDRNWKDEWEKTLRPIRVTDRIVITPSWQMDGATRNDLVLIIDPKMSFGTGYHESTRLALKLVERHVQKGVRVLDIGTGTGILAIAAIKLGAGSAVGVDIDEWSYENAQENARLNQVAEKMIVILGGLSELGPERFGLVTANIQRNILEEMLPGIRAHLEKDGRVILSGLLREDRGQMFVSLREQGLEQIDDLEEGDWTAIAARMVEPEGTLR